MRERGDEQAVESMEDALRPPNRVDPTTGLPFGWDEATELDGFDKLLAEH